MQDEGVRVRISFRQEVEYRGLKKREERQNDTGFLFALTMWSILVIENFFSPPVVIRLTL